MKTILITGASSGLGKATAKHFYANGWQVIATMRNPENESELAHLENVSLFKLDISDRGNVENAISEILQNYTVDVVLNNAGYGLVGPLESLSDEQISRQIKTNLLGTIRVTKAVTPYFRARRSGIFLNVTSMFGLIGFPTCSVYSATKFALDGFSESLAYELAQFGVRVKTIAPGGIKTDFSSRSLDFGQHEAYEKLMRKVAEGYSPESVGKYATAEAIASVIYEAATDGGDQLRYIAGKDAVELYSERVKQGAEKQYGRMRDMFTFAG